MLDILDAQPITRRGDTIHENIGEQFNRLGGDLWKEFEEKLSPKKKASNEVTFGYFVTQLVEDNFATQYNQPFPRVHLVDPRRGDPVRPDLKFRSFDDYLKHKVLFFSPTRTKNETAFYNVFVSHSSSGQNYSSFFEKRKSSSGTEWNDEKNKKRCELVDKEIEGTLSPTERIELEMLQAAMLAYRRKVAPLPLGELRELHQTLLRKVGDQS